MNLKTCALFWLGAALLNALLITFYPTDQLLLPGRIALSVAGIFLLWKLPRRGFWSSVSGGLPGGLRALVILVLAAGLLHGPVYLSYLVGWANFTYGSGGLLPDFVSNLLLWLALHALTTWLGVEVFFRLLPFEGAMHAPGFGPSNAGHIDGSRQKPAMGRFLMYSVLAYLLWLLPAMWHLSQFGASSAVAYFALRETVAVAVAGLLLLSFRSAWVTGLWSIAAIYPRYYVLGDYDLTMTTAFYVVSASSRFYWVQALGAVLALALVATILFRQRMRVG